MQGSRAWIAAVATLLMLAGPPSTATATFPGENGMIAAVSSGTIFLIDPMTHARSELVAGEFAAWSPGGDRIAYHTAPTSNIGVIGADGSGDTQLTFHEREDAHPAWSPDGTKIAFVSNRLGPLDVYVMNADGSGVQRLTKNFENDGHAYNPTWSPDGKRIAYVGQEIGGFLTVHLMNPDGSGDVALTATRALEPRWPDWAPDGSRIVFQGSDRGVTYLYTVTPDGAVEVLPNTAGPYPQSVVYDPAFSPDGRRIVFGLADCPTPRELCRGMIASQLLDGTDRRVEAGGANLEFWGEPAWGPANRRPDCDGVEVHPATLWPPNNRFRTVTLAGAVDPDGDRVSLRVTDVTHDESGAPDWRPGPTPNQVLLRATREPEGDGRVYTISFEVRDEPGATCTGEVTVSVPRHR